MTVFNPTPLSVDALVYDAYGTLFDVNSVAATAERLFPGHGSALSQSWRSKQLEYTWLQSLMHSAAQPREDFAAVTAHALDYATAALGLTLTAPARHRLLDAYLDLAPFPDAITTLAANATLPQLILSNGTREMLEPLAAATGVARYLDAILSVESAGTYKPSPRVYQLAIDHLKMSPTRIGFVSSNSWDAIGAKAFGFVSIWVNRAHGVIDRHGPGPDAVVASLSELPALIGKDPSAFVR
jgi:2-haloacid dehalogenase